MRCWRLGIMRNFSRYLNGELGASETKRLEDHLLDCGSCRTRLSRLRTGHQFAARAPRVTPQGNAWNAIEAAIDAERNQGTSIPNQPAAEDSRRFVVRPSSVAVAMTIAFAVVVFAVLVFTSRQSSSEIEMGLVADAFELRDFHRVTIADIQHNTKPHVITEGYVSEVRIDHRDGDLTFKLVEQIQQDQPFIICEIINPKKFAPPTVGSRVRVYGVSRYDAQPNHNWYEVHPVLNIELLHE